MGMEISKELIFKNFENNVTPLQRKHIDEWLRDQSNEELYYKYLEEWENQNPEYLPDSARLVDKYVSFVRDNPYTPSMAGNDPDVEIGSSSWSGAYRPFAAVIIVLLIAFAVILFKGQFLWYQEYKTLAGQRKNIILNDGTHVILQPISTLYVPRWNFFATDREVLLEGTADFAVAHMPDEQKFVVKTNKDFEIIVLGTEFSVSASAVNSEVLLKTGKVRLQYLENSEGKELIMKPGDQVHLDENNKLTLYQGQVKKLFSPESPRHFVFDQMTLAELADMLEQDYGVTVEISSEQLKNRKLMGSFMAQNLDELLNTLGELLNVSVSRRENHIVFRSK